MAGVKDGFSVTVGIVLALIAIPIVATVVMCGGCAALLGIGAGGAASIPHRDNRAPQPVAHPPTESTAVRNPEVRAANQPAKAPKQEPPKRQPSSPSTLPRTGDIVVLDIGGGIVPVCVSLQDLDEFTKLSVARDGVGVGMMEAHGRLLVCAQETKARLLTPGILACEVRILEGKHSGHSGWIAREFVRLPVAAQSASAKPADLRPAATKEAAPDVVQEDPERAAAAKLRLAKSMLTKSKSAGRKRLQEIIDNYPGTEAAAEAEKLLTK